ncbi:hypothetical protein [uncultured Pseudacidovorax sp.]|uniref:hypothetical protein n=1 Tax=uncultured Pseudacidovorax sp. TaxID=679313 RepID=UPI0025CBC536|nr:hypothetical protein [uncultured Pseudacidovorax sp.]
MTHGRKPRKPGRVVADTIGLARCYATRRTEAELEDLLQPLRHAVKALREGIGSELDWAVTNTALITALAIERQGKMRGLREHLATAELTLQEIGRRARESGEWQPVELHLQEADVLNDLVWLHLEQLRRLSAAEVAQATRQALDRARKAGAAIVQVDQAQWANMELLG